MKGLIYKEIVLTKKPLIMGLIYSLMAAVMLLQEQNNHILNLECVDHLTNIRHGTGIKRSAVKRINNPLTSKAVVAIDENGKIVYEFASISEAQRHGFYGGNVSQCCNKCFTREGNNYYKGYRWYYKEDYLNEKESE